MKVTEDADQEVVLIPECIVCLPEHNSGTFVQLQFLPMSAGFPSSVTHMPVSLPEREENKHCFSVCVCVCFCVCVHVHVSCVRSWHSK